MPHEITPGTVVGGRYRLERKIGEGGMGAVWAATNTVTGKSVALKLLGRGAATHPQGVRRFLREARAASAIRHPNVIGVHDVLTDEDDAPVMVMDLLDGETLGQRLARQHKIPLSELARIMVPVVSALGTAHALGIVHRDLKPDNIFLERRPDGRIEPKVLDFGIAKLLGEDLALAATDGLTQTGAMLGTPHYMAPEQAFGEKGMDHRADVWALGVILYQCLTGERPVQGESLGQIFRTLMTGSIRPIDDLAPELPEEVRAMIRGALVVNRNERLADLRPMLATLTPFADIDAVPFGEAAAPPIETESTGDPAARPDEFGTTEAISVPTRPAARPSRRTWTAVAGVALAGGTLLAARAFFTAAPTNDASATGVSIPAESFPSPAAAPSTPIVTEAAASAASPAGTVAPSPSATSSAKVATTNRPRAASPSSTAAVPGATAAPAPAPSATSLPGGVQGKTPF